MKTRNKRTMLAAAIAATMSMPAGLLQADEFGANTPYYEDDAWYDVSEWFDGNDYNPTDEAIGRWDDEVFNFADNVVSSDNDNFLNMGYTDYGYYDNDDDWFYDYYDDGYSYWDNYYYSNYYDIDDDGIYDSYALYSDTDGDGFYEDFDYFTFDSSVDQQSQRETQRRAKDQQKQMKSTAMQVAGMVTKTKLVDVHDRKHLVAQVNESSEKSMTIDLGPKSDNVHLNVGDKLTAEGHPVKVGDKPVLIAQGASTQDGNLTVDRTGREFDGTIDKTMTAEIRGTEHQFAKIKTKEGKSMLIDLGPKANLDLSLEKGSLVTVTGVPVKVKDRVILLARQIVHSGNETEINRQLAQSTR